MQIVIEKIRCPYCLSKNHYKTCMIGLEFIIIKSYIKWSEAGSIEPFIEEIDTLNQILRNKLYLTSWKKGKTIHFVIDLQGPIDPHLQQEIEQDPYGNCRYCGSNSNYPYFWELGLIDDNNLYWIWIWYCKDCFSLEIEVSER